jgi:hypothetical protein
MHSSCLDLYRISFLSEISVLTATSKKMPVFWGAAPCCLVEIDRLFISLIMGTVTTCEVYVTLYETTCQEVTTFSFISFRR